MAKIDLYDLEVTCSQCDGTGEVYLGKCGFCLGKGAFPTETGQALLSFFERHLLKDEDDPRPGY
jgi:hypothetical protein